MPAGGGGGGQPTGVATTTGRAKPGSIHETNDVEAGGEYREARSATVASTDSVEPDVVDIARDGDGCVRPDPGAATAPDAGASEAEAASNAGEADGAAQCTPSAL